jgi:cyclopropane fatty-acyl-phospholipid synthase-like methyltransferase
MSKPEFDQYAKEYDKMLADSMPGGMNEDAYFTEYKIALAASYLQPKKLNRVLDFGCGAGRSLPYMAKHFTGAELWGFDLSPKSLKIAAQRAPSARLFSEWDSIPENHFDLIIAANVFHHIPLKERPQAMERCRSALTKKGQFFLFEHNPYNPVTRWIFERWLKVLNYIY